MEDKQRRREKTRTCTRRAQERNADIVKTKTTIASQYKKGKKKVNCQEADIATLTWNDCAPLIQAGMQEVLHVLVYVKYKPACS